MASIEDLEAGSRGLFTDNSPGENLKDTQNNCVKIVTNSTVIRQLPQNKTHSEAIVRNRIIPTERPPLVGEVTANFSG
jgi:hypothetical protein